MAVTKPLVHASGLPMPEAYIRVDTLLVTKGRVNVAVQIFASKAARLGTTPFTAPQADAESLRIEFAPDLVEGAPNFIAQAYAALKGLDRFAGAEDC